MAPVMKARLRWAASLALLAASFIFRDALTRTMTLHMLAHIPMILLAGVLAGWAAETGGRRSGGRQSGGRWTRGGFAAGPSAERAAAIAAGAVWRRCAAECATQYARCNEYGIVGLLFASFVGAYWMIPRALDQVLVSPFLAVGKFAGLYIAGVVLCDSLRRSNVVIRLFFLGNFCWMAAIVGLLYQDSPQRLCNFYLLGDQELAGRGLVAIAVLLPLAWLCSERRRIWGFCTGMSGRQAGRPESSNHEGKYGNDAKQARREYGVLPPHGYAGPDTVRAWPGGSGPGRFGACRPAQSRRQTSGSGGG